MQTLFAWWELHWRLWVKQADAVCITLKEVNRSVSVTHATVHCNSNIPHNRERRQWGAIFSVSYTLNLRKPSYCGCLYDQRRQTRNSCNVKSTLPFLWPILLLWKNKIKTLFITVGKTAGSSFFSCANKNWRTVHLWSTYEICLALQPITATKTKAKRNCSSVQAAGDGFLLVVFCSEISKQMATKHISVKLRDKAF